ncbi:hypothetical protein AVEN_94605-2-1, partial [Araneus ventricosus]
ATPSQDEKSHRTTCNPEEPVSDPVCIQRAYVSLPEELFRPILQSRGGNCVTPAGTLRSPRASFTPASREVRNRKLRVETWE